MTTIVATREVIVSDSMVSVAHKDIWYPARKLVRGPGLVAGASGHAGDCSRFLEWATNGFKGRAPKWDDKSSDDQVFAIVVKADGIYAWSVGDPEPERIEADCYACGSGGKAARISLKYQNDPIQAVRDAIDVDLWSGGEVQILKLKE